MNQTREVTESERTCQGASNVWAWLSTWMDGDGGLHGPVVHHHRDRFLVLSPDTWTQAPAILGLVTLHEKTRDSKWLELAQRLCDYLVKTYIKEIHVFRNSNHEKKPLGHPHLAGNAMASHALLVFAQTRRSRGQSWRQYYETARDNTLNFVLPLWDSRVGSFRGWPHGKSHIHNMGSFAIRALVALSEIEGGSEYIDKYAIPAAEYIRACQAKRGKFAGAYPYADTGKDYISLYILITVLGLYSLFDHTKNGDLLQSIVESMRYLRHLIDRKNFLLSHYEGMRYPEWIPDTLLYLACSTMIQRHGVEVEGEMGPILSTVLDKQYMNGAFPLSMGFDWRTPKGHKAIPQKTVFRDAFPTPNWNAWDFWALCELLPSECTVKTPVLRFPLTVETDLEESIEPLEPTRRWVRYSFVDDVQRMSVFQDGRPIAVFPKKSDVCEFSLLEERSIFWHQQMKSRRLPRPIRTGLDLVFRAF